MPLPSAYRPSVIARAFGTASVSNSIRKPGGARRRSGGMAAWASEAQQSTMLKAVSQLRAATRVDEFIRARLPERRKPQTSVPANTAAMTAQAASSIRTQLGAEPCGAPK